MTKLTNGYKTGKAQRVHSCPREIRICMPSTLGEIYTCTNYETKEVEEWMCIKVNKDYNENVMQRVWPKGMA